MGRSVPYDPDIVCEKCGREGAFDVMGDVICPDCLAKEKNDWYVSEFNERGNTIHYG